MSAMGSGFPLRATTRRIEYHGGGDSANMGIPSAVVLYATSGEHPASPAVGDRVPPVMPGEGRSANVRAVGRSADAPSRVADSALRERVLRVFDELRECYAWGEGCDWPMPAGCPEFGLSGATTPKFSKRLEAVDYVLPGYNVWGQIIESLAAIGYDNSNVYSMSYDWRLSLAMLEERDKYFTRLK
eukprot:1188714-Prorocentrum_minimum.AAC.1